MSAEHEEELEQVLADLTVWPGPAPRLWKQALRNAKGMKPAASRWAWLSKRRRFSGPIAACLVIVCVGVTIAINQSSARYGILHSLAMSGEGSDLERDSHQVALEMSPLTREQDVPVASLGRVAHKSPEYVGSGRIAVGKSGSAAGTPAEPLEDSAQRGKSAGSSASQSEPGAAEEGLLHTRQIIRKATIELLTADVRAAFGKVSMTLNEALGEYVQESSLTGSGDATQAEITIRVTAERLSEVMNALRELGDVRSERITGQDVTAQVVDLEARLRNEQRVETEILDLLAKRQEAPLREILELRAALDKVRGQIEQLTAQRQQLGRLVSLSTVLVIIRSDKTKPQSTEYSLVSYFADQLQTAWRKGLVFLADTAGGLLSILLGGLIWWILLGIVFFFIRRHFYTTNKDVS